MEIEASRGLSGVVGPRHETRRMLWAASKHLDISIVWCYPGASRRFSSRETAVRCSSSFSSLTGVWAKVPYVWMPLARPVGVRVVSPARYNAGYRFGRPSNSDQVHDSATTSCRHTKCKSAQRALHCSSFAIAATVEGGHLDTDWPRSAYG